MSAHGKPRFPFQAEREVEVKVYTDNFLVTLGLNTGDEWEVLEVQVPGEDEGSWSHDISNLLSDHAPKLWDDICDQAEKDVVEHEDDCELEELGAF